MKPGYQITNRGLSIYTRIIVLNYRHAGLVDMVKWDNTPFYSPGEANTVAIFKVKTKVA